MEYHSQKCESKRQSHSDENSKYRDQKLHWMQTKRAEASSDLDGSWDSCPSAPLSCLKPIIHLLYEPVPALRNHKLALNADYE